MRRIAAVWVMAGMCVGVAIGEGRRGSGAPASGPATRPAGRPGVVGAAEKARRIAQLNARLAQLFEVGRYDRCEPLLREVLSLDPNDAVAWYNLACVHSRAGRKKEAVACLERSVEQGYTAFRHMERDPDLDGLRKTAGYREIVSRQEEYYRREAARVRERLRAQFGAEYLCEVDHERKLVFATNVDRTTLEEMKRRLTAYAAAQWRDLFANRFAGYVTIVVPKSSDWRWGPAVGGFYARPGRVLYARSVGYVLMHEFTHALHGADQEARGQEHPIWITEGLASLFESCRLEGGKAVPQPSRRLVLLQMLVRRGRIIPFGEMVRLSQRAFMQRGSAAYAQCCYVMGYLHAEGLLRKWYDAYTAGYGQDRTGRRALEAVFGRPLGEVEASWRKWVLSLEPPVLALPPEKAHIGIGLRADVEGVHITEVLKGGGAERAGLRPGDVIVAVDGERVVDPALLMQIVYGHEVGDEIAVRYRRGVEYHETTVKLGRLPERVVRSRRVPRRAGPSGRPRGRSAVEPRPRPGHTPAPQVRPRPRPGHVPKGQVKPKRRGAETRPAGKQAA